MNTITRQFLFLCAAALILLLLDNSGYVPLVHQSIEWVTRPAQRVVFGIRQHVFNFSLTDQTEYIKKLEEENAKLQVDAVEFARLKGENEELHKQLEAPLPKTLDFLPANILGYTDTDAQLSIDKGTRDGVAVGMAVVSQQQYVGYVSRVSVTTATVVTPVHSDSKLPAQTIDTQASGLVIGSNGKLILDKILQEYEVRTGELVVTSGSEIVPRNLVIGTVQEVNFEHQDLFKQAVINPAVEYSKLRAVFVVVGK